MSRPSSPPLDFFEQRETSPPVEEHELPDFVPPLALSQTPTQILSQSSQQSQRSCFSSFHPSREYYEPPRLERTWSAPPPSPNLPKRHRSSSPPLNNPSNRQAPRPEPLLSPEILDMILSFLDRSDLIECTLVGRRTAELAQKHLLECTYLNYNRYHQVEFLGASTRLAALFLRCPTVPRYVKYLVIKDSPASTDAELRGCYAPGEKEEMEEVLEKRALICGGSMFFDEAIVDILAKVSHLTMLVISLESIQLDWHLWQETHISKNITGVFGLQTLTSMELRGIINLPLAEIEKARNLTSLTLSGCAVSVEGVLTTPSMPNIFLDILQLKNITGAAEELAAYFRSPSSVLSVRKLKTFHTELTRQEDVVLTRAVLESTTVLEELKISTFYFFFCLDSAKYPTTKLDLDLVTFTNLQRLKLLYVRLNFRDGRTDEMDWFLHAMNAFPEQNALESVHVRIDVGLVNKARTIRGPCERTDLQNYDKWVVWDETFLGPAFDRLSLLKIIISTTCEEFCEMGRCLHADECIELKRLRQKRTLRLHLTDTTEYSFRGLHMNRSFLLEDDDYYH